MEAARTLENALDRVSPRTAQEAALVEELKAGSEEAYAYVLTRFRNPVYGLVAHILGNDSDAADVLQNVFIKVYRGMPQFHAQSSLKTWIYRIAVREALNHRRGWFRRHFHEPFSLDEEFAEPVAALAVRPGADNPYETLEQAERQQLVQAALAALPRPYRAVLLLREMEEFPYDEIAEVLGIPEGTVKSRLMRARELLRRKLAPVLGY
ncbi:MAG TPA: sigma-70 family RNA polymerase sigma factor [Terriglobia bacterium]|nr:sigma-70 family RNA polymerase sigma factor [Terriglobia bacterium]